MELIKNCFLSLYLYLNYDLRIIKIIMVFESGKNTYSCNSFAIDTIPIKAFIYYLQCFVKCFPMMTWIPEYGLGAVPRANREPIEQHSSPPPTFPLLKSNPVLSQRSHTLNYVIFQLPNEILLIKRFLLSCRMVVSVFHN